MKESKSLRRLQSSLILIIGAGILFGIFYAIGVLPLRLNPAFRQAISIAKNDPAVAEVIGPRVWTGLIVWGTIEKYRGGSGYGNLEVSLYGSENKGELFLYMTKERNGEWVLTQMSIDVRYDEVLEWVPGAGFAYTGQPSVIPAGSGVTGPTTVPVATPQP